MIISEKKSGRPKKPTEELRTVSIMVQITKTEQLKLANVMKELSAGSLSNTLRMLLNQYNS